MLHIDTECEIKHVQAREEDESDPQGRGFFHFNAAILARLLFCDTYVIDEIIVKGDTFSLAVHYTGPAMPRGKERNLCWDVQQRWPGNCGAVSLQVMALEKQ